MNLLKNTSDFRFATRKRNIVNVSSNANHDVRNETVCNTEVLKSNLCDYNYAYILVRSDITVLGCNLTQVAFVLLLLILPYKYKFLGNTEANGANGVLKKLHN